MRQAAAETSSGERLTETFARCRKEGRAALVSYVMAGDPDLKTSLAMALACISGGTDILEIGFPFSDPVAEGPTIQRASERALKAGASLSSALEVAAQVRRKKADIPIAMMGYVNTVLAMGAERFFERCSKAGVDAVIIPDLPPDESQELAQVAAQSHVKTVFLLAPTSTPERRQAAYAAATGFIYYVSVTGVTGARTELPKELQEQLLTVRQESPLPVVVGFGISSVEHVQKLAKWADGVVVGSAIVSRVAQPGSQKERAARVSRFVGTLKRGLGPGTSR